MRAERTFWEEATAIHVFCAQGVFRGGDRFARHWYEATRLDAASFADSAIADMALAKAMADHKSIFFPEKGPDDKPIGYHVAVSGGLRLVPDDGALTKLATDYQHMVDDGLFLEEVETFDACWSAAKQFNRGRLRVSRDLSIHTGGSSSASKEPAHSRLTRTR
jgi:Nucleotidyl transferase AbiEii toxin, Type IV TA system